MNRREVIVAAGITGAGLATSASKASTAATPTSAKPVLAMLAYPGMFPLDLVAPEAVFSAMRTHKVEIVAKTRDLVRSDSGLAIAPTMTLAEAPALIDILFVPGGSLGTMVMMEDPEVLGFLASRALKARYITSVCTGSLILAAAGLMKGYRATSHWALRERLAELGAIPVDARVVEDRNRVTGAGVTAGADMALTLASRLVGETYAKAIQLNIEYDPDPPFDAGTPDRAGKDALDLLNASYKPLYDKANIVIPRVSKRLGLS